MGDRDFWRCSALPLPLGCLWPGPLFLGDPPPPSLQSPHCRWQTGLLYFKLHQVTWAVSFELRTLLGPLAAVSPCCTPSHGGEPASSAWPQRLQRRKATHGDGVARNTVYRYVGDGGGGGLHRSMGAIAAPGCNLHKSCRGLQPSKKALPLSPSNHERQEQRAAGSDWFAPVASLQAPRDSSSGTAGFLKGHLQALILRWGRG